MDKKGKGGKPNQNAAEKKDSPKVDNKPKEQPKEAPKDKAQNAPKPANVPNTSNKPKEAKGKEEAKPEQPQVKESKQEETTAASTPAQVAIAPQPNTTNNQNTKGKPKPEKVQREYVKGKGTVKSVLSGDVMVVIHFEKNRPPQEKEIALSNVSAPKLGRRNKDVKNPDEDFAFASREFLRKNVIGKNVSYTIESKGTKGSNREYGIVYLISKDGRETDLAQLVIGEGWAKVRGAEPKDGDVGRPLRADVQELLNLQEAAQKNKKGIWDPKNKNTQRPTNEVVTTQIYEQFKGKPLQGVVERALTGSTLIVTLFPGQHEVRILLSGVECPQQNADGDFEAFGREAKFCTEYFLLHRDVNIILEGADKFTLFGTLDYNGKNISEELLNRGFARYVEWSGSRTAFSNKLKAAEKLAKDNKLGIWSSYVEPKALSKQDQKKAFKYGKEIQGTVTAVVNAGMITVTDAQGAETQVSLSSIAVPRGGNMRPKEKKEGDKEDNVMVGEAPKEKSATVKESDRRERAEALERTYAWEGKEYLRRRLIGQKVKCVLDYNQPAQPPKGNDKGYPERNYFSVYIDKNNVAVELTAAGYAVPRKHRSEEPRSKDYEDILKAESIAKKLTKGQFIPVDRAAVLYINDISQSADKARKFLPSIKRGRQRGVVTHVFNAGKLKVYVPKESCELTVSISALKVPRQDEPLAVESTTFVRTMAMQRDVEFEVSAVDRGGNFVGNVYLNKENLAAVLLREGYATLIKSIAQDSEHRLELENAETNPKRKEFVQFDGVRRDEIRAKNAAENAKNLPTTNGGKKDFYDVMVTEIIDATTFYVQIVTDEAAQLDELMSNLSLEEVSNAPYAAKKGDFVKAQYTADDSWYRATVESVAGDQVSVFYIDYGNSETIPADRVKALSEKFQVKSLKAQAVQAHLAFIKPPTLNEDYGPEAAEYLKELVEGRTMMANIEYESSDNSLYLSLGDRESQVHVNAALVRAGLAKAKRPRGEYLSKPKAAVDQLVSKLREEEDKARSTHTGIWTYGDPGSDEEDEKPFRGKEKKAPAKKSTSSPAPTKKADE